MSFPSATDPVLQAGGHSAAAPPPRPGTGGARSAGLARRLFRGTVLVALATQLAAGAWASVIRSVEWILTARAYRHDGYQDSRHRALGWYTWGLVEAERRIPPGEAYILVDDSDLHEHLLLQGDLAPRRAVHFTGPTGQPLPRHWRERGVPAHAPAWTVIFHGTHRPPSVLATVEYAEQLWHQPR